MGVFLPQRKLEVFIYDDTDVPVPDTNGNDEDVEGDGSRYVYEFCSAYSPISLNTLDASLSSPNASPGMIMLISISMMQDRY